MSDKLTTKQVCSPGLFKIAMDTLRQIKEMPRKTREQRLACSTVHFIEELQKAKTKGGKS